MVAHRFWQVPELVAKVCWQLLQTWPDTNGDLVAVALCCWATFYPAIDCIWRDLQDVEPLLRLLDCNEDFELLPLGDPARYRPKPGTTMERYKLYCGCIRTLLGVAWEDYTMNWPVHLSMETLRFVAYGGTTDTLLTSLRWLEWNGPTLSGMSLFWGPKVTTLSVAIALELGAEDPPDAWLSSAIDEAAAPEHVERLVLHGPVVDHVHVPHLLKAFHGLVVLQLPLYMVSADTVRQLVTLPALLDLRFHVINLRLRAVSPTRGFASLDYLELHAPSTIAMDFFLALPAQHIREIVWVFSTVEAAGFVAHEYGPSADTFLRSAGPGLRVLRVIQSPDEFIPGIKPRVDLLPPLFRAQTVEEVEISINLGDHYVGNEMMTRAFRAWPRLHRLKITTYGGHLGLDMQCIMLGAACCPDLRHISLPVAIRWGQGNAQLGHPGVPHGRHGLQTLCLNIVRSDNAARTDDEQANQLAKLTRWLEPAFPLLELVEIRWSTSFGGDMDLVRAIDGRSGSDSAARRHEHIKSRRVGQWEAWRLGRPWR